MDQFTLTHFNLRSFVKHCLDFSTFLCMQDIKHERLQQFLREYPENFKFDLILWDHSAGECLYPVIERFGNPPLIGLSPYGISNVIEAIYGGHVYPYVGQLVMPFVEGHHFWQRMWNALYINYYNYKRHSSFRQENVDVSKSVFPEWSLEKFEGIEERFSLCLVNWNVAFNQPQALTPNVIPVGGVHVKPEKDLPKNLEAIFQKAQKGVIYFSLGTVMQSEVIPVDILNAMGQCFRDLPQYEIIWKIVTPPGVKLPTNVHNVTWAPQTTILSQPKTKLFVTHGGGHSLQETTFFGVPILGIPIFLDQSNNIEKLRLKAGGEMVTLGELYQHGADEGAVKNLFCSRLNKVLLGESYGRVMKRLSSIYQDVRVKPMDEVVYWVEYVLRHGDIQHLSPWSRRVGFIQTQNLDLYGIVIVVMLFLGFVFVTLLRCLKRCCFEKRVKRKTN